MTLREAANIAEAVMKQGRRGAVVDPHDAKVCGQLALRMMVVLNRARQVTVTARPISTSDPDAASQVVARQREVTEAYQALATATLDFEDWLESS